MALQNGTPEGFDALSSESARKNISKYQDAYPRTRSKKGLQVQMVDDAIALGIQHAAFNIDIGSSIKLTPASMTIWPGKMDGRSFGFDRSYIGYIDRQSQKRCPTPEQP